VWIDRWARGPVSFLYAQELAWTGGGPIWSSLFWNRSIDSVYALGPGPVYGPVPYHRVRVGGDGSVLFADGTPVGVSHAVASAAFTIAGRLIAQGGSFALWQVDGPLRLATRVAGMRQSGDIDERARMTVYDCDGGKLELTLRAPDERRIVLFRDGQEVGRVRLSAERPWSGTLAAPHRPGETCTFGLLSVGGGVHADRLEYVRAGQA
jgi:hypothetical protein